MASESQTKWEERLVIQLQQCERKIPYQTQSQAECNMNRLMESRFYDGKELRVYRCPCGNHFHIGHV